MDLQLIREKAEAIASQTYPGDLLTQAENAQQVLHELHVHQIELELQNEELRRIQESLLATRQQYFELYNFAPVAYLTIDAQGVIKNINLSGATLLGRDRRYLIDRPLLPYIAPDYQGAFFRYLHMLQSPGARGQTELLLATGAVCVAVDAMTATTKEGTLLYRMVMTDITHLRRTERQLHVEKEQLAITLRSIAEGVIVADTKGQISLVNPSALAIIKAPISEVQGHSLLKVFPLYEEDSLTLLTPRLLTLLQQAEMVIPQTAILQAQQQRQVFIELSAAPIKDHGVTSGIVLIFRDETENRRQQAEQLRAQKLEALGMLAGGIAHDFNNLLAGLFGNIEIAKLLLDPTHKAHKFLDIALRPLDSAANLTKQLFTFAQGGAPIKEMLAMGALLTETAQFSLHGSNLILKTQIAPDLYPIEADKGQMVQVISNLVINASQAMPHGGVITISAYNVEQEDLSCIEIRVQDEGVGIAPQHIDKIFDPYFTTKQTGSGLGLTSSYSIIRKHNGSIRVTSRVQQGTIFTICLPAMKATVAEPVQQIAAPLDERPMRRAHILVLDDEEVVRNMIGAMLERLGHSVKLTSDCVQAMLEYQAALQSDAAYDAVIVDLMIPGGMGGQEVTQELLKMNPAAKIILSSGYATDPVIANYEAYGFTARVIKPYRFDDLRKVVAQVLNM